MARTDPLEALGLSRDAAGDGERALHLEGFIKAFVEAASRERVRLLLRREGWTRASTRLRESLDPRWARLEDAQSRPTRWPDRFRGEGLYIASVKEAWRLELEQASALSLKTVSDAVFSLEAGRRAVFLDHEWGVWWCERNG